MVVNGAGGVGPAHPRAGVPALVVDASQGRDALRVDSTLMPALHIGVALQPGQAGAGGGLVPLSALGIDATRRRPAGINYLWCRAGGGYSVALTEWVALVSLVADTDWNMVPYSAVGIDSTQSRTRILALAVDAGFVGGAVRVDDALWPAVGRRADHVWQAGAVAALPNHAGRVGVRAAGVGITWVNILNWFNCCKEAFHQKFSHIG